MISAYSLRKMGESSKISRSFFEHEIEVDVYNRIKADIKNENNSDQIENDYDLKNKHAGKIKISMLLNQIIP